MSSHQGRQGSRIAPCRSRLCALPVCALPPLARAPDGGKVQIAVGVTADCTGLVKAGELVNFVAAQVGGKGGGKADMAMAGGTEPAKLAGALASVQAWVSERI